MKQPLILIKYLTDALIEKAYLNKEQFKGEPINWGNLRCNNVGICTDWDGTEVTETIQIRIEETGECPRLKQYIYENLPELEYPIEIITEW